MTHMVDTSLEAWAKAKPKLGKIHTRVYECIVDYPDHTTAELGLILKIPTQSIAGRPGELSKKGLIKRVRKRKCAVTKNEAWIWGKI